MLTLNNPGFESGDTGWIKGLGWSIVQSPPVSIGIRPGSVGSWQAFHTAVSGHPDNAITNSAKFACIAGQVIGGSAWIYHNTAPGSGGGKSCVRVIFYKTTDELIGVNDGSYVTNNWAQSIVSAPAPLGAGYAVIDIATYGQTTGTTQVDDVIVSGVLETLSILPDSNGYGAVASSSVLSTLLAGGAPRLRATQLGAVAPVDCQWTCDPQKFEYLQSFYRVICNGSRPFIISLILEGAVAKPYTVTIEPKSWRLISQKGLTYVQGATLNVLPSVPNIPYDQGLVDLYGAYGQSNANILSAISTFVNITLKTK